MLRYYTMDEIGLRLAYGPDGRGGSDDRQQALTSSRQLDVDLSRLDTTFREFARDALDAWSAASGIAFSEYSGSGADITFYQPSRATAEASWKQSWHSNDMFDTRVTIGTDWLRQSGETYTRLTFVHEIGHALGLQHAGDYNGSATFGIDNEYLNDSVQATVMSYFRPSDNPHIGGSDTDPLTPMPGDIAALRLLYGTTATTRTGDDVYGFGSTAGRIFDPGWLNQRYDGQVGYAYTIIDDGGTDTWNLSGEAANQIIDLAPGALSSIGGYIANAFIDVNATIENAHGGGGDDRITGNAADNVLTGNGGDDRIAASAGRDLIDGGAGSDTLVVAASLGEYDVSTLGDALLVRSEGSEMLVRGIEWIEAAGALHEVARSGFNAFDGWTYLASNADLADVLGRDPNAATAHYLASGFLEGRASDAFDPWTYLASNLDLRDAGLSGETDLAAHYVVSGRAEGRSADSFDPWGYLLSNDDLLAAFGLDTSAAARHFVQGGDAEGRATDAFNGWLYLASNTDLVRAGIDTLAEASTHYLLSGRDEGRTGEAFELTGWSYLASNDQLRAEIGSDLLSAARDFVETGPRNLRTWSDWMEYLASNPDLALAFGPDPYAAARHFVTLGETEGRDVSRFDEWTYLASNPNMIGDYSRYARYGSTERGQDAPLRHFVMSGVHEGRVADSFDPLRYAASNTDLIGAFGTDESVLARHYVAWGFGEGRSADAFDPFSYLASHADLRGAFGMDGDAAVTHYLLSGLGEGRAADAFDEWAYLAANDDLIGAVSTDDAALHFVANGAEEERPLEGFDAAQYLANYADLVAAFGDDEGFATRHYVTSGFAEGRTDDLLIA